MPPKLQSWGEYERSVNALINLGVIEDSSKIWWDLRPSANFFTIESRICDVSPRLEHALTIAALTQSLTRMLWRLGQKNQRWRLYDNFLLNENRWRAQRYGVSDGLIDFGRNEIVPMTELVDEMIEILTQDAEALECLTEIETAREITANGNSSMHQRAVYEKALADGKTNDVALQDVVKHLIEEYHIDL